MAEKDWDVNDDWKNSTGPDYCVMYLCIERTGLEVMEQHTQL